MGIGRSPVFVCAPSTPGLRGEYGLAVRVGDNTGGGVLGVHKVHQTALRAGMQCATSFNAP